MSALPGARTGTVPWWPVRAYNAAVRRAPRLGVDLPDVDLPDVDEAVAEVEREVPGGAADLGDGSWRTGLAAFLGALWSEAALTPAGRRFARGVVRAGLTNRMRVHRALAAAPAAASRPVGPAIVVVGLPRSGTTLLQHLLALDPDNRSLRQWEAVRPSPAPGTDPEADARRIRTAERSTRLLDRLVPQARVLHPTGALLPTECVSLFTNSFANLEVGCIYQVPSYVEWCLETDMRPHYSFCADQLRLLAQAERRSRWVLKSPAHVFWLRELTGVLPEATILSLRRDPLEVLISFCRLVVVLSSTTTDRIDPRAVRALWSRVWAEGLRRAAEARVSAPAARCIDVEYTGLVADPVGTVASIYEAMGQRFDDGFARSLRDHVATYPRPRAAGAYTPEDCGLDADHERRRFDEASREGPRSTAAEARSS